MSKVSAGARTERNAGSSRPQAEIAIKTAETNDLKQPENQDLFEKMIEEGRRNPPAKVHAIIESIIKLAAEKSNELFSTADFLVTPTVPIPPPTIETLSTDEGYEAHSDLILNFTVIGTLLLGPAITIPNGFDNESLPVGFQIIGPPGADRDLFSFASTTEASRS